MGSSDDDSDASSSVGIRSRSGSWRIDSTSEGEGVALGHLVKVVAGRRRNPRRNVVRKVREEESVEREKEKKVGKRRSLRRKSAIAAMEKSREVVSAEDEEGDDAVERMRAMTRLPAVLIQVRKYGHGIVAICDQMEKVLLGEAGEAEMDSLKQKLNKLSEKCYEKVRAEFVCEKVKEPEPRRSRRINREVVVQKPKPTESEEDSEPLRVSRRVDRTNSVDYTEYVSPDRSESVPQPPEDSSHESAKDSGNPSSGQDESPAKDDSEAPVEEEVTEEESLRDAPAEETGIMDIDITDPDPDCNLFFDSEQLCPPPTESMMNETSSIVNDDIFAGLQNDHDAYTTPIHREILPPPPPTRLASPKKRDSSSVDTPTTSMGTSRSAADSHRRLILPVVQQSLEKYFQKKTADAAEVPVDDEEVLFVSATAGRRQKVKAEPAATPPPVVKPTIECEPTPPPPPEYVPEPGPSKAPADTWMVRKVDAKGPKFVTNSDPDPNRKPTTEEVQYTVPHQPKFSVAPTPQGENPELELMKREIECRLRVNELSWVTLRAIREETTRAKKVERNNEKLEQQLARYQTAMPENQLILDYDAESQTFIRVHPELVQKLKPHQRDGVKFMYDCCYGGVTDVKNSNGSGCILAHCMGLGKTLQVIALMNTVVCYPKMKTRRIIVICPKSTVMNWAQEIQHWLGDIQSGVKLKVFYLPDSSNIYKKLEVLRGFHETSARMASVLLIGYEAFRSLVFYDASNRKGEKHSEGVRTEVRRVLINPGADLIILDEGHIIKNRKSQTNLAVAEVATKRRIILTGTPIQNNLNEYYCMVNFVKPAYLGSEREFNEHYATPIKNGQHADSNVHEVSFMKMQSFILHKNLLNFVQRKEFEVLRGFLPQKFEYVLYVPLTPVQEDLYEQYLKRNPLRKETGGMHLLEDYTFLRKIWTHPIVLERAWETAMKKKYGVQERQRAVRRAHGFDSSSADEEDNDADRTRSITNVWWKQIISADDLESLFPSNKMILLFEILRLCQERGEKCLIFSGFVMVLNMVEHFMKMIDEQGKNPKSQLFGFNKFRGPWRPGMDFYRIDGGTSKSTRHEMVTKFNDPKNRVTRVFLISTKAGGQGINLVGANRVIILDTSWNPAVDQQGIFRIYRLGQQKTCYIYRLLAMHTMEEKVYSRAVTKQAMSHRVADKKQVDRNYSMADLEELYHFERADMGARPNAAPADDDLLSALLFYHHKLIYRYHTHETMLDNKTEKDLSETEKQVAWSLFKSKGQSLTAGSLGTAAGLVPTDSHMSDPDVDSELMSALDQACEPTCYDDVKPTVVPELPPLPLAVPVKRSDGNNATIFGDDPYDTSYGGGMSIIEEQRQRMSLKPEAVPEVIPSQVSPADVELLRELEERVTAPRTVATVKEESYEPPAKKVAMDVPVLETVDLLDLSYEGDSEEHPDESHEQSTEVEMSIPPSIPALKSESFSSIIEYDPVGSQEPSTTCSGTTTTTDYSTSMDQSASLSVPPPVSYEKFKASLVEDPYVTTSTTAPSPAVVVVATSSSPAVPLRIMTRSMKRAADPIVTLPVKAKKIRLTVDEGARGGSYETNQCRALVPFTGHRVAMNPALKDFLELAISCTVDVVNPCRALVPYVPRTSLLEVILAEAATDQFSSSESSDDDDSNSDTESASSSSSYPTGLLTQTSTLSWTAADLAAFDENITEFYTALSDLDDADDNAMDFSQHSLPEAQRVAIREAQLQKEHADLMASLDETRQVVNILEDEQRCLAVVPYNPPTSLWHPEERITESEPKSVVFHASLERGLKRKREKDVVVVDNVVWKKPRTTKVYRVKRRVPIAPMLTFINEVSPIEDPEPAAKLVTGNSTLSWGDEEVDFVDYNISCGEIEQCEQARQLALVPYQPPPPPPPTPKIMYCPLRSFWDPTPLLPLIDERKGQILKAHHNKLFRFVPYDKGDRKWRKVEPKRGGVENTCRSLIPYAGRSSPFLRFLFHPLLVGYLSFCRYVTEQSTMRQGVKRKANWESMSQQREWKRPRAASSAPP